MSLRWVSVALFTVIAVVAQTNYRSCDASCLGVYGTSCNLAQSGLSGCIVCSEAFNTLDKTSCRACLVQLNNATIIEDFDYLVTSCQQIFAPKGPSIGEIVGIVIAVLFVLGFLAIGLVLYFKKRRTRGRRKPRKDLGLSMELDQAPISGRTQTLYENDYAEPVRKKDKYDLEDHGPVQEPEPTRKAIRYPDPDDEIPSGNIHFWRE